MSGAVRFPALKTSQVTVQGEEYELTELSALDRCVTMEIFAGVDPDGGDMFSSDFYARVYGCTASLLPEGDDEERQALEDEMCNTSGELVDELWPHVAELSGLERGLEDDVEGKSPGPVSISGGD